MISKKIRKMKEKNSQQHSCFLFFFFKPLAVFYR
jgi:hypothetical protein